MHLHSYRVKNFRRLADVYVELSDDISIFVGANNSGKTSATQALDLFLSGRKSNFSLYDLSSHNWKILNDLGEDDAAGDAEAVVPEISLDLWFGVTENDLHLVLPILPSMAWQGKYVGVRIVFSAKDSSALLSRFREKKAEATAKLAELAGDAGDYVPWPAKLTDYLERELDSEFDLRYFVLDHAQFNDRFEAQQGYSPSEFAGDKGGAATLESLVKVDCLYAQRHLEDPSARAGSAGRAENLSRRLSKFYQRNLAQRAEDHAVLKALFESEQGLNKHLMDVFDATLQRLSKLGYPGLYNPKLEIISGLNPATVMSQDAKVHYLLGNGAGAVRLPDSYNGLGFKNLIYMVVEILDRQEAWKELEEDRPPLHLIFIEEPEAHLHAQLQQVFIRNVLDLLKIEGEADGAYCSQVVVTTHSPHILYERGFAPIRYFRRHTIGAEQATQVLNLSSFQPGENPKDREFLQRYMKLTHCDLFFADAAILVEGNVERLLMPSMIAKAAPSLRSVALCILEVGGAFGHRFKELIEFLGITTLLVTDIDSVALGEEADEDDDEDEGKEIEVPAAGTDVALTKKYASTCLPSQEGAMTANQSLIQWLPRKRLISELWEVAPKEKAQALDGNGLSFVRVAYQTRANVEFGGVAEMHCGRTLEEAFGLENANWCQAQEQKELGLRFRVAPTSPADLALKLHKRVTGKNFDKTKFALGVLTKSEEDWVVPHYIAEGLCWLREKVDLEIASEADAVIEVAGAMQAGEAAPQQGGQG